MSQFSSSLSWQATVHHSGAGSLVTLQLRAQKWWLVCGFAPSRLTALPHLHARKAPHGTGRLTRQMTQGLQPGKGNLSAFLLRA